MEDQHPIFYTEHGEVHCVADERGRKKFLFVNQKSERNSETVAYMKIFTGLANYLGEAQRAAGKYIADKKRVEAGGAAEEAGETAEEPPAPKKKRFEKTEQAEKVPVAASDFEMDENAIYTKILSVYGKDPLIRVALIVNVFEENPYVWLKRFWYRTPNAETLEPAKWLPCFGSYRFGLSDDPHELHRFAKKCLIVDGERKGAMAKKLKDRALYHDAALSPPRPAPEETRQEETSQEETRQEETSQEETSQEETSQEETAQEEESKE